MKAKLTAALAAIVLTACVNANAQDRKGGFAVPPTSGEGGWIAMCITELRYTTIAGPYGLSGFTVDPDNNAYFFSINKSGVIISPGSTPVLVPSSEWFDAPETPDVWSFLREAADGGDWVEFFAWEPNGSGVARVTQIRRQYPAVQTEPCPTD